jgi:hypothetical protein
VCQICPFTEVQKLLVTYNAFLLQKGGSVECS